MKLMEVVGVSKRSLVDSWGGISDGGGIGDWSLHDHWGGMGYNGDGLSVDLQAHEFKIIATNH